MLDGLFGGRRVQLRERLLSSSLMQHSRCGPMLVSACLLFGCGDSNDSSGNTLDAGQAGSGQGGSGQGGSAGTAGNAGSDAASDAGPLGFCAEPLDVPAVTAAPAPATGNPLNGIELFDGWTDPRALAAPVNTPGWEDSAFISHDGTTLFYGYSQLSFDALQVGLTTTISSVNSEGDVAEAAIGANAKTSLLAFVRFEGPGDVFLSCKGTSGWSLPAVSVDAVNTPCIEDNPHLSEDGATLWFDSNRADAAGTSCKGDGPEDRSVWVSRLANGSFGPPTPLSGGPTAGALIWQVFTLDDGALLYWTGRYDTDCAGRADCLYEAARTTGDDYGTPTLIARPKPMTEVGDGEVLALGEMSITADGAYLYFVYLAQVSPGVHDLGIGVAHR